MNIDELAAKLKKFFSKSKLRRIGKKSNFIIRERKITALGFLKNIIFSGVRECNSSLEYMSSLFDDDGISLTKQSIARKINDKGVEFLKIVFEDLCREFMGEKFLSNKCKFKDVLVLDSSEIKLNKRLLDFKNTRNGPRCKVQAMVGLLTNTLNCEITKANKNDQSYKDYLKDVKKDHLIMFDLGYFCIESFKEIIKKGAHFVSRYLRGTTIMDHNGKDIDLIALLQNSNSDLDMQVLIGRDSKLPCRIVGQKLTGDALKSRLEKLERDAKKSGKKRTASSEIDFWSIYITDLHAETVSGVHDLYVLRWQIELLFKVLKSKLSMDEIKDNNADKAMIMIYSKLISIMIVMILIRTIQDIEISLYKAIDYYKDRIKSIYIDITNGGIKNLHNLVLRIANFAQKLKTKNRSSSLEKSPLQIFFSTA